MRIHGGCDGCRLTYRPIDRGAHRYRTEGTALELSTPISSLPPARSTHQLLGLSRDAWIKIGLLTVLFALAFWPSLRRLWLKTNPIGGEPEWGHSMIVPVIGLFYLVVNREALLKAPVKTAWGGLPILLVGLFIYAYGIWPGQNDFIKDFGMVVTLFGLVTLLCGWAVMKIAWFPIVFLICAIPWPGLVYSRIAGPLQLLAAKVAVHTLSATGVNAWQGGTKIFIGGLNEPIRTLNVAEACAGLRSLMTFISIGAAIAFLSSRPLWQKIFITLSAIPIAIFCNVMRIAGQGLLDTYVSHQFAEGFAHQFVGLVMLIPAFFLLLLVGWILDQLFIEEVDDKSDLIARSTSTPHPPSDRKAIQVPRKRLAPGTPQRPGESLPPRPSGIITPNISKPHPPTEPS